MTAWFWAGAGVMLACAALAAWGERRRKRRADLDRVGLVDWPTVQMIALFAAAVCASLAFRE